MVVIENLESLKTWLVNKLTPMCDADPNALAKYVVALVRKDKSEEDLRKLCVDQLEVFLQARTTTFVAQLFDILKNKNFGEDMTETTNAEKDDDPETKEQPPKRLKRRINRPSPIRHRSRSPYDRRRRIKRSRSPRDRRRRSYRSHSGSPKRGRLSPKRRSPVRRSRSRSPYRRSGRRARSLSSSRSRSSSQSHDSINQKGEDRKKTRCWDFDQKGFCVLGENCQYDHGKDPVVLEDSAINSANRPVLPPSKINPITAPPPLLPTVKPAVPPPVLPPPPFLPPPVGIPVPPPGLRLPMPPRVPPPPGAMRIPPPGVLPLPPRSQPPPGYNPEAPGLNYAPSRQNASLAPPMIPGLQGARSIITAPPPIPPPLLPQNIYPNAAPVTNQNPGPRNTFISNNTKLVIRKIPPPLNNISKLNEHFCKFGAINNIQVKFENDAQSALVEYAHVNSARAAKRDPGAVMNNRFITVYWYNGPNVSNGNASQSYSRGSVKERLGTIPKPAQLKYTAPSKETPAVPGEETTVAQSGTIYRTISNKVPSQTPEPKTDTDTAKAAKERLETKSKVQKAQQATKEKLMARQKVMLQKKIELQKQKRQILEAQMAKQKLFLQKIKGCTSPTQKKKLTESLQALMCSMDKLRSSSKGEVAYDPSQAKEKQQKAQKEVLDAELDLYNATTTGESTSNLKRKLSQLKMEASSLGLVKSSYKTGWGRGRGRGSYVPRPKAPRVFSATATLDRRPRELRVTGFHEDEKDELVSHLSRYGEIEQFSFGDDNITCTVKFQTRAQSEAASAHGMFFKNRRLVVVWASGNQFSVQPATATATVSETEVNKPEEESASPPEDTLVVGDEKQPPEREAADDVDEDDESDNVNVHIGDVTVGYGGDLDDDVDDNFEDELDEDALLDADFDEDVGDDPEFDDEELRSWRR